MVSLDSFILDRPLFDAAIAQLTQEGEEEGYGAHIEGRVDWDGESDAFAQFASRSMLVEDFGPVEDPREFYSSRACRNRLAGVRLGVWMSPLWPLAKKLTPVLNSRIEAIRAAHAA